MKPSRILLLGAVVSLAVGVGATARTGIARPQSARAAKSISAGRVGARMPDFCLNDLDGRRVCSSQFRGKTLLID
ncbi:MAG: hypothetical protein ACRD37_07870, partial [Candidatus Acidiferrales bacterium]